MDSGSGSGDCEVQWTVPEPLNQLDGFEASDKIKVLMATNRIDILDQALPRPGRLNFQIPTKMYASLSVLSPSNCFKMSIYLAPLALFEVFPYV
ncbi:hypothetical protein NC652_016840 [Populus alba x Populus x berolinensis]|nr:hypothetical protein NC652_016840 [Populus alba x Populus x berolinensis]